MSNHCALSEENQAFYRILLAVAGRNAAKSRLYKSGRLIIEDVGEPLGRGQYLNPRYWINRTKDAWAMKRPFFNDLRPGNYGQGFRPFDPAIDPFQVGLAGAGGILYGGYKLYD